MSVRVEFDETCWPHIERAGGRVVDRVTEGVEEDAHRFVPVLTGALDRSIESEREGLTGRVWVGTEDGETDYWRDQEYGTHKMEAQPFMRPALYRTRSL